MLKVADQCWVALARLHRADPSRSGFRPNEILRQVKGDSDGPVRAGIQPHIAVHNIANAPPSPAQYRMFFRLTSGEVRLFREGDHAHPARKGKLRPDRSDLPNEMQELVDWYDLEYSRVSPERVEDDPVLAMRGVGKELWAKEDGDTFIRRLRDERGWQPLSGPDIGEQVWARLRQYQGETFYTATGLVFRYELEGSGVWFERNGSRINRKLSRADVEKAVSRLPLRKTTDIKDCIDYAYLFGLLTDERIVRRPDLAA